MKEVCLYGVLSSLVLFAVADVKADSDYAVIKARLDNTRQAKQWVDTVFDCANNPECTALVDAGASYLGAPPGLVTAFLAVIPQNQIIGEETRTRYELPPGYQYCKSKVETISVIPATGERASFMSATRRGNGIDVYTWTPRLPPGQGRSWVEANFTIMGIKDFSLAQAAGCVFPLGSEKYLLECRGASGVNKGLAACSTYTDP